MKNFDVHIIATASDYYAIEAETPEEAREQVRAMIETRFKEIVENLKLGLDWIEQQDIEVTDVIEY